MKTGVLIWVILCTVGVVRIGAQDECDTSNVTMLLSTNDVTTNARTTVLLYCFARAHYRPSISWEFGNTTISNDTSERYTIYEQTISSRYGDIFVESILEICHLDLEDTGEYLCTATDEGCSVSVDPIWLIVEPEIVTVNLITPSTAINARSTILLYCFAYGYPVAPSVTWQFNGTNIPHYQFCDHTHILYERQLVTRYRDQFTESILQICDVKYRDSGEYLCIASSGYTTVTAPPTIIAVLPEIVTVKLVTPSTAISARSALLLYCFAHGFPVAPSITWQFNGTIIPHYQFCDHTHIIYERQVETRYEDHFTESILQICDAKYIDSGEYLCTASSGYTSVTAPPINITILPETVTVVAVTSNVTINSSSTVYLVCMVHGYPASASISWQFNGTSITNHTSCRHTVYERVIQSRYDDLITESILKICDVGLKDSGNYLCSARSGIVSVSAAYPTTVTVLNNNTACSSSDVSLAVSAPGDPVDANSTVRLVCTALGNPAPSISWKLGDITFSNCTSEKHTVSERTTITGNGMMSKEYVLEILSVQPEDSGEYLCTASYGYCLDSATNAMMLTVVPIPEEPSNVTILMTSPDVAVDSSSTAVVVCVASGNSSYPSISWHFNGSEIYNDTSCRHTIYEERTRNELITQSILEVSYVGFEDAGEYTCSANSGATTITAANPTRLIVDREEPSNVTILMTTPNGIVNSSSTAIIVCVASGSSSYPSISWHFNGSEIHNDTSCRHTIYEERTRNELNLFITQSILEVSYIGFEDTGDYTCSATSGATTVTAAYPTRLIVVSREDGGTYNAGPPLLEFFIRNGIEDVPIRIRLVARPSSDSTSRITDLIIRVTQIPANSTLSGGITDGNIWNITSADFGQMELYLPEHAHGTFFMTVEAIDPVATDYTTRSQRFTVTPAPDAPLLTVVHDPCICSSMFNFKVDSSLVDTGGSETLEVTVAQLPEGVQLSAGLRSSNSEYTLNSSDILNILIANFTHERFNVAYVVIVIHARAIETSNGARAVTSTTISVPWCSTNAPIAPAYRNSADDISCPRLEFYLSLYNQRAVQPGSCVAIRPQARFEVQLIAVSGTSDVSITQIQSIPPVSAIMGNFTRISNSDSYYINITWTPQASQWNQVHMLCFSAVRSNGLPIDESCINLLPGSFPPRPIRSSASPNQQLVYPSNTTWRIMYDSNVQRPSVHAYITFLEYTSQVEVYRIDVSESQEVAFSPANGIVIRPNFTFTEQTQFYITFDRGIVSGLDLCGSGNEPLIDKNFWTFETRDTTPPTITFLENPSQTNANVSIRWESNENVTWECVLVHGTIESIINCSEGYWMGYGLSAGLFVLEVRGQDLAGNIGIRRHTFEVDLTPPVSTIMTKPARISNLQTSMLTFTCNEMCTFECQLIVNTSVESYSSCDSGTFVTPALQANTNYTFLVTATDFTGNIGESVPYSWVTDYEAPSISVAENASALCNSVSPQHTGEALAIDNQPEAITLTYSDVHIGCLVRRTWTATDFAGNIAHLDQNISVEVSTLTISLVSSLILSCDSTAGSQQVTNSTAFAPNPCRPPVPLQLTYQDSVSEYSCPGSFVRNWTVTSCGSSATTLQTITLYDLCPTQACGRNESTPRGSCSFGECFCNRPWYGENCDMLIYEPVVDQVNDSILLEAQEYSVVVALLQGTPPLTWIITSGPYDLQVNQRTGQIIWNRAEAGNHSITIVIQNQVGETSVSWNLQVIPGYTALLDPIFPTTFPYAQPIVLTGRVQYAANNTVRRVLAGIVPVDVDITTNGAKRTITGYTAGNDSFSLTFYPVSIEYGRYTAGARHPNSELALPQTEWNILGMTAVPRSIALNGETFNGQFDRTFHNVTTIINNGLGSLSGLSAYAQLPNTMEITVEMLLHGSPSNNSLEPGEQLWMDIRIVTTRLLRGSFLAITESSEGTRLQLVISLRIEAVLPSFQIDPARLSARIVRGIPRSFEFNITNVGRNVATNVRSILPTTGFVSQISFRNAQQNDETLCLESGESAILSILAQIPASQQLGEIDISIIIASSEVSSSIPVTLTVSSNLLMNFTVIVEDEYTHFADGRPLVDNAIVTLINYQRNIRAIQTTEVGNGTTTFTNIYEDRYEIHVEAPGHRSHRQIMVTSLNSPTLTVFIERQAVRYTWSVTPVTYQDVYIIPIVAEFETHVPIPVVTVTPTEINLDDLECGAVASVQLNITNHGLIRADNVSIQLPTHPFLVFSVSNNQLGDLEPLSSVIVSMHSSRRSVQKRFSSNDCEWVIYLVDFDYSYVCNEPQYRQVSVTLKHPGVCRSELARAVTSISHRQTSRRSSTNSFSQPSSSLLFVGLNDSVYTPVPPSPSSSFSGLISETPTFCDPCDAAVFDCLPKPSLNIPCAGCIPLLIRGVNPFSSLENALRWAECTSPRLEAILLCLIRNDAFYLCGISPISFFGRNKRNAASLMTDLVEAIYPIQQSMALGVEVLGDSQWISVGDPWWLSQVLRPTLDDGSDAGVMISASELSTILSAPPPNGTTIESVRRMVERVNNTISGWNSGQLEPTPGSNMASYSAVQDSAQKINGSNEAAINNGFLSYLDYYNFVCGEINEINNLEAEVGVCAVIRIRILQELALTREAFQARLEIENQESSPLQQIDIEIDITDTQTGERAKHRFSIGNGTLSGSLNIVNGGLLLPSDMSGSIEWLIIPYSEAAPQSDHVYDVGGSLNYVVDGENITVPLSPTPITVQPDPSLLVHYFLESRVPGDDPFTEVVEPSVPFTLGVAVKNAGYGTAYSLQISSGQPEIFDNERGLLISFMIIGANIGNKNTNPSLTVMFGDIDPNTTVVARWYMVSTLQGEFTNYSATFENRNPLGDPKLSILDELKTHKLVKNVMMYNGEEDDGILDFLVNDRDDYLAYPDGLYSSKTLQQYNVSIGSIQSINISSDNESTSLAVEATTNTTGWVYYRYEDTQGILRQAASSINVTKLQGNQSITIPPENAWVTIDRDAMTETETFCLHIVDYIDTSSTVIFNTELCIVDCPIIKLPVKLPTPNITISVPDSVLYAEIGKSLQVDCNVYTDLNITSNVRVSLTWFRGLSPIFNTTDRVTISPISDSQLPFTSTLTVYPLKTTDNDYFTCRVGIVPFSGVNSFVASDFGEQRVLVVVEEAFTGFTEVITSQVIDTDTEYVGENQTSENTLQPTTVYTETNCKLKFIAITIAGGVLLIILILLFVCCCYCCTHFQRQQKQKMPIEGKQNILANKGANEMTVIVTPGPSDSDDDSELEDGNEKHYTFIN